MRITPRIHLIFGIVIIAMWSGLLTAATLRGDVPYIWWAVAGLVATLIGLLIGQAFVPRERRRGGRIR